MAYENGRRVHKYYKMLQHKDRQKKRYQQKGHLYWCPPFRYFSLESVPYWEEYYLSSRRKLAKQWTNDSLRMRELTIMKDYLEDKDVEYLGRSEYQRYADYWWIVW
jgi:hypothetical protein